MPTRSGLPPFANRMVGLPRQSRLRQARAVIGMLLRWLAVAAICWLVRDDHRAHRRSLESAHASKRLSQNSRPQATRPRPGSGAAGFVTGSKRLSQNSRPQATRPRPGSGAAGFVTGSKKWLTVVQAWLPEARRLVPDRGDSHAWIIQDPQGNPIGQCLTTSPVADSVVGFSGPTNVLIVLDSGQRIVGLKILESRDTPEHVAQVAADSSFLKSLNGRHRSEVVASARIDAVSGATLTSTAILESVQRRLSGRATSLRFPNPVQLAEVKEVFATATQLERKNNSAIEFYRVLDHGGRLLGNVVRSAPYADSIIGYQGPTDTLWFFDAEDRLIDFRIRRTFDNSPYTDDVADDPAFREMLRGRRLADFADYDPRTSPIEGVSGATITSRTILLGLKQLAKRSRSGSPEPPSHSFRFSYHDTGTTVMLVWATIFSFTRWRRSRRARLLLQIALVGYLGFFNGDMLSQALLAGWVEHGIPWQRAPALALMVAAALLIPAATGNPWYCHSVCPFGAAQGLLRRRANLRVRLPRRLTRILRILPALLLGLVLLVTLVPLPCSLAAVEPFHAFLWPVAGVATLLVAVVGLVASAVTPMAYCRFGCPTGALLEYLRWNRRSALWQRKDVAAVGLLLLAVALRLLPSSPNNEDSWTATSMSHTTPVVRRESLAASRNELSRQRRLVTLTGAAMGTNWVVKYAASSEIEPDTVRRHVAAILQEVESEMSHWRQDSVVSRFNRAADGLSISPRLARTIDLSRRVWRESSGALDITIGPLVRRWGFGPRPRPTVLSETPKPGPIHATLALDCLDIRSRRGVLYLAKSSPQLEIDLSAVAKGAAVDAVIERLEALGLRNCLVGLGGEFRARGSHPSGRPWYVAVERPRADEQPGPRTVVPLRNCAIATSGTYRQQRTNGDGLVATHVIDPRTGYPVRHGLLQVSVCAESAAEADAWATALLVLGRTDGFELAQRRKLAARFVWQSGHSVATRASHAWHSAFSVPEATP